MTIPYGVTAVALCSVCRRKRPVLRRRCTFSSPTTCAPRLFTPRFNLPYATMAPLMTRDENDLAKINLFRMSMSPIGNLIVSAVTLPLINRMGGDQAAWIKVTLVYAVVAMILLLWCFFGTKERVNFQAASKAESLPLSQRIKALGKNKYFSDHDGRHAHAGYLPNAQRHGCHLLFAVCTRSQRVFTACSTSQKTSRRSSLL